MNAHSRRWRPHASGRGVRRDRTSRVARQPSGCPGRYLRYNVMFATVAKRRVGRSRSCTSTSHRGTDDLPSVLCGFSDVLLEPGESKGVTLTLSRYDLSLLDSAAQGWRQPESPLAFAVGANSRNFRLNGTIPL
ncbi:hypothetical protein V8D89_006745 [Ganoderma adspersum]